MTSARRPRGNRWRSLARRVAIGRAARNSIARRPRTGARPWSCCSRTRRRHDRTRRVTNPSGSVDLAAERDSTRRRRRIGARARSRKLSEAEVTAHFRRRAVGAAAGAASLHAVFPVRVRRADRRISRARARNSAAVKEHCGPGRRRRRAHRHDGDAAGELRARVEAGDDRSRSPRRGRARSPPTIEVDVARRSRSADSRRPMRPRSPAIAASKSR